MHMIIDEHITARIDAFKNDLPRFNDKVMVQKYITSGECYALTPSNYFDLKTEVSNRFRLHPSEVVVVGSSKLGFSIANDKRYRHFGDESDIDIAIVSGALFEQIWIEVFEYRNEGAFWPEERAFKDYLFRGWVRPDKLPPAARFEFRKEWWDFFRGLEQRGSYGLYKIRAGIYKSWYFLENYQSVGVKGCRGEPGGEL